MKNLPLSLQTAVAVYASMESSDRKRLSTRTQRQFGKIHLTQGEFLTLQLVASGVPNKNICVMMKNSIKTIEKHRDSIREKLGIHHGIGMTHWAIQNKIVTPGEYLD